MCHPDVDLPVHSVITEYFWLREVNVIIHIFLSENRLVFRKLFRVLFSFPSDANKRVLRQPSLAKL